MIIEKGMTVGQLMEALSEYDSSMNVLFECRIESGMSYIGAGSNTCQVDSHGGAVIIEIQAEEDNWE